MVQAAKENPLPLLLAGAGVAWFIAESKRNKEFSQNYDYDGPYGAGSRPEMYSDSIDPNQTTDTFYDNDDHVDNEGFTDKMKEKISAAGDSLGSAKDAAAEKLRSAKTSAGEKLTGARESLAASGERTRAGLNRSFVSGRQRSAQGYSSAKSSMSDLGKGFQDSVQTHPLGIGLGFIGLGVLAGLLLPNSEKENAAFGDSSDDLFDAAKDKAGDLLERGKEVAGRVADKAVAEADHQGLTSGAAAEAGKGIGSKVSAIVDAAKDEAKEASKDENLTKEALKSESEKAAQTVKAEASKRADNLDS